jgi:hypothetical protein
MQKWNMKRFISGVLITAIIMGCLTPTLAENVEVIIGGIKLLVKGEELSEELSKYGLTDELVPSSIIYNNTAYFPVGLVNEWISMGNVEMEISEDGKTYSIVDKKIEVIETPVPTASPQPTSTPVVKSNGIGAPGADVTGLYGSVITGGFSFKTNSVNGVEVSWIARNNTGKEIKYYTLFFAMYNPVGDPAYCRIKKEYKIKSAYVGPVKEGGYLITFDNLIGYSAACSKIVLESIYLEYMDGTNESIEYGYETTRKTR